MRAADPGILERAIYALSLLSGLSKTELDFVFKGGTALLLHLPNPLRLSIDIDIVCETDREELAGIFDQMIQDLPFHRWEEHERAANRLPKRLHFKFFYQSPFVPSDEVAVLLDVVTEANVLTDLVQRSLDLSFIETTEEIAITTPSANALLGDKLTAFAPNTVGVPLRDGYTLQVIKQLFDIGQLYDVVTDTSAVADANRTNFESERGYRKSSVSYRDYLDDVLQICETLCCLDLKGSAETETTGLLRQGIRQLPNHLIQQKFRLPQVKIAAGKAAALATFLRQESMVESLPLYDSSHIEAIKAHDIAPELASLQRLKKIQPEAYFYWMAADMPI